MVYKNKDISPNYFCIEDELVELEYDTVSSDDEFDEYVNYILDENDRIVSGLFEQD